MSIHIILSVITCIITGVLTGLAFTYAIMRTGKKGQLGIITGFLALETLPFIAKATNMTSALNMELNLLTIVLLLMTSSVLSACISLYRVTLDLSKILKQDFSMTMLLAVDSRTFDALNNSIFNKISERTERLVKSEAELFKAQRILTQNEKAVKALKENLIEERDKFVKQIKEDKGVSIELPQKKRYLVDDGFLELIGDRAKRIVSFALSLRGLTNNTLEKIETASLSKDKQLFTYLDGLCELISVGLFDNPDDAIRIHFRILNSETNCYESIMVYTSGCKAEFDLTPIPIRDESMIARARQYNRSIVKSLNPEFHFDTSMLRRNVHEYDDYITSPVLYRGRERDERSLLMSMGISITTDRKMYRQILCYLSYCKIEKVIQDELSKVCVKLYGNLDNVSNVGKEA